MGDEFDDTSLDAMDIAPVEDSMPDISVEEHFDIPESFEEDAAYESSYDGSDSLAGEDLAEVSLGFVEDVDDLNDVNDPDPYDVPQSFVEDTEEINADNQTNLMDGASEMLSEDAAEVPTDFGEDSDDLNDTNDPDPYDIPESFNEDTDVVGDSATLDGEDAPESCDISETFEEDTDIVVLDGERGPEGYNIPVALEDGTDIAKSDNANAPESYDMQESFDEDVNASPATIEDLYDRYDKIANSDLTNEHKLEVLRDMRDNLPEEVLDTAGDDAGETGPVKVLKRDEMDLLTSGNKNIDDTLSVMEDDYRDKGYTDDEIASMLANDKIQLQGDFLRDAFPGQEVSLHIFDNLEDTPSNVSSYQNADHTEDSAHSQLVDDFSTYQQTDILTAESGIPVATDLTNLSDLKNWLGDINPNFDEFDIDSPYCNNCGSCAYAVYQRFEGSQDACASADNIPYNSDMTALTGMEQVSMSPDEIRDRLLAEGDGAHAIIGIDRAEGCGHWFNAACIDGKVVAIDGQTGEVTDWPPDYGDVVNWEMSIKKENLYGHKTR